MGRRSTVGKLPADVRHQLTEHLRLNPGWTLDSHTEWLAEQGYIVARSSLHRYIIGATELHSTQSDTSDPQMRMRALEVASSIYKGSEPEELIALAEQLLTWVEQPSKLLP